MTNIPSDLQALAEEVMYNRRVIERVHQLARQTGIRREGYEDAINETKDGDKLVSLILERTILADMETTLWAILERD